MLSLSIVILNSLLMKMLLLFTLFNLIETRKQLCILILSRGFRSFFSRGLLSRLSSVFLTFDKTVITQRRFLWPFIWIASSFFIKKWILFLQNISSYNIISCYFLNVYLSGINNRFNRHVLFILELLELFLRIVRVVDVGDPRRRLYFRVWCHASAYHHWHPLYLILTRFVKGFP